MYLSLLGVLEVFLSAFGGHDIEEAFLARILEWRGCRRFFGSRESDGGWVYARRSVGQRGGYWSRVNAQDDHRSGAFLRSSGVFRELSEVDA